MWCVVTRYGALCPPWHVFQVPGGARRENDDDRKHSTPVFIQLCITSMSRPGWWNNTLSSSRKTTSCKEYFVVYPSYVLFSIVLHILPNCVSNPDTFFYRLFTIYTLYTTQLCTLLEWDSMHINCDKCTRHRHMHRIYMQIANLVFGADIFYQN